MTIYRLVFDLHPLDRNHFILMDTFSEPYTRRGDDVSIDEVCQQIKQLEDEHVRKGIPLSGRIIHVCHYLPITATLLRHDVGVPSPPATPPSNPSSIDNDPESSSEPEPSIQRPASLWSLSSRHGHAAMISGIRSLSQGHEQLIVGWTGDVQSPTGSDKIPFDTISQQERNEFDSALKEYEPRIPDSEDEKDLKTRYVPIWLEDKVAHGHYDGYCKQSAYFPKIKLFLNRL